MRDYLKARSHTGQDHKTTMLNMTHHLLPSLLMVLLVGQVSAFVTPSLLLATQANCRSRRCSTHAVEMGLVGDVYGIVSNAPVMKARPQSMGSVNAKSMTWPEYCAIAGEEATVSGFREMRQKRPDSSGSNDGSQTKSSYYYVEGGMSSWVGWLRQNADATCTMGLCSLQTFA